MILPIDLFHEDVHPFPAVHFHLLPHDVGLEPLTPGQIRLILDTAEPFKEVSERAIKKVPALRGKTIVNLFFEPSTRTRISFEFAEKRLSADTVNVAESGSSVSTRVSQSRGDADRHGRDPPRL